MTASEMAAAAKQVIRTAELPEAAMLVVLSALVFLGCMLVRSPGVLLAPRFWAEEGHIYYQYMQHVPWLDGLRFVYSGNYQLLTNAICPVAAHVPERYAAYPTTYLSAGLDVYCCFLPCEALRSRGASLATAAAAVALFATRHAGYEVFLNATNVMWVCSASTLLIALGGERRPASPRAWLSYASVAAFGLTGVTSVALAPVYIVQALRRRSAYRGTLLAVLGAAAVFQASVVHGAGDDPSRAMRVTPQAIVPIVFQAELANFVPSEALDAVGARTVPYDAVGTGIAIQVGLVGAALLALFGALAARAAGRGDVLLIAGAMLWIGLFDGYGGIGDPLAWHSGWGGSRYFFLGDTCFLLLVCLSRIAGPPLGRAIAFGAMALAGANAVVEAHTAPWVGLFTAGPSVSSQVRACAERRPCAISYPPHGPGAEFDMDRTPVPGYRLPMEMD